MPKNASGMPFELSHFRDLEPQNEKNLSAQGSVYISIKR
jgi:hypothetical protein